MEVISPQVASMRREAAADPEGFWARAARKLPWFAPWEHTFEWEPPTFRWFIGGRTNLAYNCLDRHVERGWGGHAALVYENERGQRTVLTYAQLLEEVKRVAAALRGLGIGHGDRVGIYMATSPEAIAVMLACARIGAIHLVVFAGFGAGALGERVRLAECKAVFAGDITYRKGKDVPLKGIVDEALRDAPSVETVVIHRRSAEGVAVHAGRDITWQEFLERGRGQSSAHEVMESNEPAYILATSGTTAKPKLAVHTHGPYQVLIHSMGEWVFGLHPAD